MKKSAIVTGASRGIGRAVVRRLAKDGFAVVVNYVSNAAEAEEAVAEIKKNGGEAVAIKADVGDPAREAAGERWVRSRSQLCQQRRGGRGSGGRDQEERGRGGRDQGRCRESG